jgi:putative endonuclease
MFIAMHYVYVLKDERQKVYVGYSHDLKKRLEYHRAGEVVTTKTYTEPQLVWYCAFRDKKKALDFENYLKAGSGHAFLRKRFI